MTPAGSPQDSSGQETDSPGSGQEVSSPTSEAPEAEKKARLDTLKKWLPLAGLAVVICVHFIYLMSNFAPAISAIDANGYWAQAGRIRSTGRSWFELESNLQYVNEHWYVTDEGKYVSHYPPGLPMLVGLVFYLFGYKASLLVNPILASLTLLGLYLLMKRLLAHGWCLAGAIVLALNPIFNKHAIVCDSHMAVAFCLVWGIYLLLRWSEFGKHWEIFLAGLVFGSIPSIRYAESVFALAVVVYLLLHIRSREKIWQHYLLAVAGAAIPLIPLLIRNHLIFGAFYRTAYSLTREQTGFGWNYFTDHFVSYIRNLHGEGIGIFFSFGAVGLAWMSVSQKWRRQGILLVLLVVPITLLYMSYYWSLDMRAAATMRFLVPTFACYIIAGIWLLSQAMARAPRAVSVMVTTVVVLLQVVWGQTESVTEMAMQRHLKNSLAQLTSALEKNIEPGDVVMANSQVLQHLDFVGNWRLVDIRALSPNSRFRRRRRFQSEDQDQPSPWQPEKQEIMEQRYIGLSLSERDAALAREIRQWAGGGKVYFAGTDSDLENIQSIGFGARFYEVVANVKVPEPLPELQSSRRGFRFGPGMGFLGGGFGMGPPGGGRGFRPGGGSLRGSFMEAQEIVIAEWIYHPSGT